MPHPDMSGDIHEQLEPLISPPSSPAPTGAIGSGSDRFSPSPVQGHAGSVPGSVGRRPYHPDKQDPMYSRLKYYRSLPTRRPSLMNPPVHVLPEELLVPTPLPVLIKAVSPNSSIAVIFSIANLMLGSSLLVVPWAFDQAGVVGGTVLIFSIGLLCYYTSRLIIVHGDGYNDFAEMCTDFVGAWAGYVAISASLIVLVGAVITYHTLMSSLVYQVVNALIGKSTSWLWNHYTPPILIAVVMLPLSILKQLGILVKISSVGILFVLYTIAFVLASAGSRTQDSHAQLVPFPEDCGQGTCIAMFHDGWGKFASLLPVSFFVHNAILPIVHNQGNPATSLRDHAAAFVIVGLSYQSVGFLPTLAQASLSMPLTQNYLSMFDDSDVFAFTTRIAVLWQLVTVYPLLLGIVRQQFFGVIVGKSWPGRIWVALLNIFVLTMACLVAMFFSKPGSVLSFTGAVCGSTYVVILPILVHLSALRRERLLSKASLIFHIVVIVVGVSCFAAGPFL